MATVVAGRASTALPLLAQAILQEHDPSCAPIWHHYATFAGRYPAPTIEAL